MVPAPYFYLREDERALLRLKASPSYALALFLRPLVLLSVLLALALVARAALPPARAVPAWAPWAGWGALLIVFALVAWRRAATLEYVLTDARIYARSGRLVTRVHFTTHDKITDIHYHQGPIERALGLADLTFATAGGDVHVAGVPDALALKAASARARDAFVRALLHDAPPTTHEPPPPTQPTARALPHAAPDAPAGTPWASPLRAPAWGGPRPEYLQAGDTPVWHARPRPIVALASLRSLVGLVPVFFLAPAIAAPWRGLAVGGALALIGLSVLSRVLQVQRTEYIATDRRVYARTGVVGTSVIQLTYDKITDIAYRQDLLGRLLGFGSVTLQTAGGQQAPITMVGLADPLGAKETIERWRDASLGSAA